MAAVSEEKRSLGSMAPRCSSSAASFTSCRVLADKCREDLKGNAHKETRKQLLEQASAIYQADSAAEARVRLGVFAVTCQARAPKAVATLGFFRKLDDARGDEAVPHREHVGDPFRRRDFSNKNQSLTSL